jgi:Bifunctional DNA primase/polymerase, N-terminal
MTPLEEEALCYAVLEQLPVFPCLAADQGGRKRRSPHTSRGFHDASNDPAVITRWWESWPNALIGMPTGKRTRRWVLDIDVKDPKANGFDTLEDLGRSILPQTPMAHTSSGGLHVYFDAGERELRCSVGLLGPGFDIRGDGGYVIIPSEGSGYEWDPLWNFMTVQPVPAPDWLWPPKPSRPPSATPIGPVEGLNKYGEAAINAACNAICRAPNGEQERTLNAECFSIGTLAGAGAIPDGIALRMLLRAASAMPDHDPAHPWRQEEIGAKVKRAFDAGTRHPREARRERAA